MGNYLRGTAPGQTRDLRGTESRGGRGGGVRSEAEKHAKEEARG